MHKLNRPELDLPSILDEYDYSIHTWDDFKTQHKKILWDKFYEMQGHRCAYCEKTINPAAKDNKHIEHFRRKGLNEYKHLTFSWQNLFGSCAVRDRCGVYKDKQEHLPDNLIKMDDEDPEKFFTFLSTGRVSVNVGLSDADKNKANETLRVFNLDPRRHGVKTERLRVIESHQYLVDDMLSDIDKLDDDEMRLDLLQCILDEYLDKIKGQPFETTIKHILISNWKTK